MECGMDNAEQLVEAECTEVFVYNPYSFGEVLSGIAEIDALDDDEIYVFIDDEPEIRLFKREHVHPCNSDL